MFLSGKKVASSATSVAIAITLAGCQGGAANNAITSVSTVPAETTLFRRADNIIPFEDAMRRKWDAPVIADLDQDGLQDIIITEHGNHVRVFWNNGGTFSAPQNIATGDMHGIAVSDFDRDGRMDLIMAQGGGDGANPKRPLLFKIGKDRTIAKRIELDYFQPGRGRAVKFLDPDGDGALDLLVTGFPTEVQKEGANHLYKGDGGEKFIFLGNLPQAKWLGYRVAPTRLSDGGVDDLIFFGGANFVPVKNSGGMNYTAADASMFGNLVDTSDVSSIVRIDFDNDGDQDLFMTRAEHQFDQESYYNAANKTFAFLTFRKPYLHDNLKVEGDLKIENLQRTFPHFDIYLGADRTKLPEVQDRHRGRNLTIRPQDAMGYPEGPTDAGLYIGYLGNGTWRIGGRSQSRLAAVIHNVTEAPPVTLEKKLPVRLFENRGGKFVDVTEAMGISIEEQTTSAAAGDFDNDGFTDLAILRYGDMATQNEQILYMNQAGKRFVRTENHGLKSTDLGTTGGFIDAFDYNSDGAIDLVYADERGRWRLMMNSFADEDRGNFTIVRVGASPSGKALSTGAELTIKACGQIYRREVGAGSASFSQSMNSELHVGLGSCERIEGAVVHWSNGETAPVAINELNQPNTVGIP